jgi:hypothetical protein
MKNTGKFKDIRRISGLAVIAAIGFIALSLTGCPTPDQETVATPTADPPAGAVVSGTEVTLTTATPGAEIFYTTNGSDPANGTNYTKKYTGPILIDRVLTIKAIAVKKGMYDSSILEAGYTITEVMPSDAIELTENKWADGELSSLTGVQWFKFKATASTQYIHAGFVTMNSGSSGGLSVQVYNSNSDKVGNESHLYDYGSNSFTSRDVTVEEYYYIKVRPYSSSNTGMYQIAFNGAPSASSVKVGLPSGAIQLTEDRWTDGELTALTGVQWFKFTATASPQYIHANFVTMSSSFGYYVQVYDSNSAAVESETILYGSGASAYRSVSRSVTPGEVYYIKVRRYSNTTSGNGTYQIAFNGDSSASSVKVTLPSNAIQLAEGKWYEGNLTSSSSEQWFKFTATANPQYIHAAPGTINFTNGGVNVQVYDSNGAAVGAESRLYGSLSRYISRPVTSGQEFYIKVRPYSSSYTSSSYTGTYQIVFNKSSTAPVQLPSNATPLTENFWSEGNLTSSSPEQWFKFTATENPQYIHANFISMNSTSGYYVQVYDSNGAVVGSETNLWSNTKNISRTVTPGEEYYIKVRLYNSSSIGTYQIAFNTSTTAPTLSSGAITLTENTWTDGNLSPLYPEQWFKFIATANPQYIHAAFGTLVNDPGLYVQVYNSSGAVVGTEVNLWGNGNDRSVSRNLTPGQEYYIKVRRYSSNYNGTYRIAFNTTPKVPSVPVTPPSGAATLTENTWANGSIASQNSEQWFKFIATAGTQYIHANIDTMLEIYIQLYDLNAAEVGEEANLYIGDKSVSQSLTPGQEYYIRVWPNSVMGTYQIAFSASPTAPNITLPSVTTPLSLNNWVNSNFTSLNSLQWFRFTATANTQYIHFNFGTLQYIYVQVFHSSGAAVGDVTILPALTSYIARSVTQGQDYYIQVYPAKNTGTYKIAFNASSTAPSP